MSTRGSESRLAWGMSAPAVAALVLVLAAPLLWTFRDSFHRHDLRRPDAGAFIGLANYREAIGDERLGGALARTGFFLVASVGLELLLGTVFALALHHSLRARAAARTLALLPWAIPAVVTAILWRFLFEGPAGPANRLLGAAGVEPVSWFAGAHAAWVPILLADVWKTTPFVMILVLAALAGIPRELHESARLDGAGRLGELRYVTLPLLRPALVVALLFRSLDAVRVFDLVWVLTSGGPGDATEPVALYAFRTLLEHLRFGYGSAVAVVLFTASLALGALWLRALGRDTGEPA